jgi:hypothetical protein
MLEKNVEKLFVREVQARGGITYKFTSPGNVGVPDRIAITPEGQVWFVELKTETGRLSRMQEYQLERLRRQNCNVVVLYGGEEVEKVVTAIFNRAKGGDAE